MPGDSDVTLGGRCINEGGLCGIKSAISTSSGNSVPTEWDATVALLSRTQTTALVCEVGECVLIVCSGTIVTRSVPELSRLSADTVCSSVVELASSLAVPLVLTDSVLSALSVDTGSETVLGLRETGTPPELGCSSGLCRPSICRLRIENVLRELTVDSGSDRVLGRPVDGLSWLSNRPSLVMTVPSRDPVESRLRRRLSAIIFCIMRQLVWRPGGGRGRLVRGRLKGRNTQPQTAPLSTMAASTQLAARQPYLSMRWRDSGAKTNRPTPDPQSTTDVASARRRLK